MIPSKKRLRFYIVTLGCPKNEVDSDIISSILIRSGFRKTLTADDADIILVNSCGFIQSSKEETINTIIHLYRQKRDGQKIIMLGCLAQRYSKEIPSLMYEVDGFIGADKYPYIDEILKRIYCKKDGNRYWGDKGSVSFIYRAEDRLLHRADKSYTYIKIADGCSNQCSFCAIPSIKGKYVSRKIDDILLEIDSLKNAGYKEIGLVSQDLTAFGFDYNQKKSLLHLLKEIEKIRGDFWIRLYYLYPRRIDTEVLETIAKSSKIVHYLDIPFQHVSDRILQKMKRGHNQFFIERLISRMREFIPDIVIRSTFIVGFPSENRRDFAELKQFLLKSQIDNVGFFEYSDEEGTLAFNIGNKVNNSTKKLRLKRIYEIQEQISLKKNQGRIGKVYKVLIDSVSDRFYIGRYYGQAPEIDGVVYIRKDLENKSGFVYVKITDADSYDLYGEIVK